jgi:hypothetical protein
VTQEAVIEVRCVRAGDGWTCEVTVEARGDAGHHTVDVAAADLDRWGGGRPVEDLVRRSFEFLLEREPPSSILRRFDLSVIPRYFPEYDQRFRK